MRQLIIARKDLNMSAGKLSAQCAHTGEIFLTNMIRQKAIKVVSNCFPACTSTGIPQFYLSEDLDQLAKEARERGDAYFYAKPVDPENPLEKFESCEPDYHYEVTLQIDKATYEDWICGIFTKTVCAAKNRNHLMKAVDIAKELGLKEGIDFFLIKDNCLTELEPEEYDENGIGRTLTCIGFRPLSDEISHKISKKYQLYK